MIKQRSIYVFVGLLFLVLTCAVIAWSQSAKEQLPKARVVPVYSYKILKTYTHNTSNFTQGFAFDGDLLVESTGLEYQSKVIKMDLSTNTVLEQQRLEDHYFAEGVTVMGDKIYLVTYTTNIGFIYDKKTLKQLGTFNYPFQGWGITNDGSQLIISDGSSALVFMDPSTFEIKRFVIVKDGDGREVGYLNELEYIDGKVYANVWEKDVIAIISPESGNLEAWIDLSTLNPDKVNLRSPYVLNGIAYNKKTGTIFVTGKCWPSIYEIEITKPGQSE